MSSRDSRSRSRSNSPFYKRGSNNNNNNSNNGRDRNHRSERNGTFKSTSRSTTGYGTKTFTFGKRDKNKWSKFLTNLNAEFATNKIAYLNNDTEVIRRKTAPATPVNLQIPIEETDEEYDLRKREQRRIDDDYKAGMDKYRNYCDSLEIDYATAIGLVLMHVSSAIRTDLTLVIEAEQLASQSSENRYRALRAHLEIKHGPNSQKDAETLRRSIQALNGDQLGWEQYTRIFDEGVQTLTKTVQRDSAGTPIRGPTPNMPTPTLLPNGAPPAMILMWYENQVRLADEWNASPHLGAILNHRPNEQTMRGWLMHAMSTSRHSRIRSLHLKYIQPDHQHRSYTDIRSDLDQVVEDWNTHATTRNDDDHAPTHHRTNTPTSSRHNSNSHYTPSPDKTHYESDYSSGYSNTFAATTSHTSGTTKQECKNCGKDHITRDCDSLKCSICHGTFETALIRPPRPQQTKPTPGSRLLRQTHTRQTQPSPTMHHQPTPQYIQNLTQHPHNLLFR